MIESVREANKMSAAVQNQKVEKTSIVTEDRIELEFSQQGIQKFRSNFEKVYILLLSHNIHKWIKVTKSRASLK